MMQDKVGLPLAFIWGCWLQLAGGSSPKSRDAEI